MRRIQSLPPLSSAFLDVIRFCSAVAVLVGHFSHPYFLDNGVYHLKWALDAVGIFFVLSGFVIRFITSYRPTTAWTYGVDRFSRIYSVFLPSVVFSLQATLLLSPAKLGQDSFASVLNLLGIAQLWGNDIFVSTNSVYWSLCYECAYYLIYGIAFFGRGWRMILALAAVALVLGPPILVMLPLWLLGAGLHDLYQVMRVNRLRSLALLAAAGVTGVAALVVIRLLHLRNTPPVAAMLSAIRHLLQPMLQSSREHHLHLLARANPQFYLSGGLAAVVILVVLLLLDKTQVSRTAPVITITRRIADGTFALYMFHVPMLLLIRAYIPYSGSSPLQRTAIGAAVIAICVFIQGPLDQLKDWMRLRTERVRRPLTAAD